MTSQKITIKADPRKGLFIDMLTRDINLADCILDLIDNSIDSILFKTKFDPMKGLSHSETKKLGKYKISISFTKSKFSIEDNSEGVDPKIVEEKVFRFGSEDSTQKKIGLSVYGIGMKRAFFKIGRQVQFESTSTKGTVVVNLDVDKWVKKDNWEIEGQSFSSAGKSHGTKIVIQKITEETVPNFESQAFETRLIEKIQTTYGIFLDYGLQIEVNGKKSEARIPTVIESKGVKVTSKVFKKDGVQIKIIAGITPEDDKKSNGWFIFCNGRMILEADKTSNTGWGDGLLRKFHASTNRFVGFVYFKSEDGSLLPWTTTKNGVNVESSVYQFALGHMITIARPIVSFLVKKYKQDKTMKSVDGLLKDGKEIPLSKLGSDSVFDPDTQLVQKGKTEEISYTVTIKDIQKIKKIMKEDVSNEEIGKRTFYYYLEHED